MALRFGDEFESNASFNCSHCTVRVAKGEPIRYEFLWRKRFHTGCADALIEAHGGNAGESPNKKGSKGAVKVAEPAIVTPALIASCDCENKFKRLQAEVDSLHEMIERLHARYGPGPLKPTIDLFS